MWTSNTKFKQNLFREIRNKTCSYYPLIANLLCALTAKATMPHNLITTNLLYMALIRGRDSSVGIATSYGLGGPGIEFRWGACFSASVQTGPEAHPASYTMGTGSFPGVKRPGCDVNHPTPSSAEVEGRVELYIYSTLGLCGLL